MLKAPLRIKLQKMLIYMLSIIYILVKKGILHARNMRILYCAFIKDKEICM